MLGGGGFCREQDAVPPLMKRRGQTSEQAIRAQDGKSHMQEVRRGAGAGVGWEPDCVAGNSGRPSLRMKRWSTLGTAHLTLMSGGLATPERLEQCDIARMLRMGRRSFYSGTWGGSQES